jgi:hypothetical protein
MRVQAERDEITLNYVDEACFALVQPNRRAWTPRCKCNKIDVNLGKRLNVLSAILSTDDLCSVALWQTTNSIQFVASLGLLMKYVCETFTVILDNALFRKGKALQPMFKVLDQKGPKLYFLPTYCPQLNLRKFNRRNVQTHEKDVRKILPKTVRILRTSFS